MGKEDADHLIRSPYLYVHINPKRGNIETHSFSPVVVMKKIKLRCSDWSGPIALAELPELLDEDDSQYLESLRAPNKTSEVPQNQEVSFIHTLNQKEMNDHIQTCLEMSSENKITLKNAFALQLIDCMAFLMQKKKDFSTMACTLDAGAKIYSYRVDALHHQVIKLADEVILHLKQRSSNNVSREDNKEDRDAVNNVSRDKRKANKKNVISSVQNLNRKPKGKDPRDKYIKFEALPGAIISGARRDAKDLSFRIDLNVPFWPNWMNYKPTKAKGEVTLPEITIHRDKTVNEESPCSLAVLESQTTKTNSLSNKENGVMENPNDLVQDSGFVVEVPMADLDMEDENHNSYDDSSFENQIGNVNSLTDKGEVDVILRAMERLQMEAEAGGAVNKAPSRLEAMKMLFDDVSEYNYLNTKNSNYWAGPEFWKRPQGQSKNILEKPKHLKKKREPGEIVYDFDTVNEKWMNMFKRGLSLTNKTVKNWKTKKTTLPTDLKINVAMFLDLFHMSTCRVQKEDTVTSFVDLSQNVTTNGSNNDTFMNHSSQESMDTSDNSLNATFYEGIPGNGNSGSSDNRDDLNSAFYDVGIARPCYTQELASQRYGKIVRVEIASTNINNFGESSLVPPPKRVRYEPIKYSTRPIRVNMQHLKQSMKDVIDKEVEQDAINKLIAQNVSTSSVVSTTTTPETKFSDVFKKLPRTLGEDVSPAIAFMALLTLANENNLQLENTENYNDVVVKLEGDSPVARSK